MKRTILTLSLLATLAACSMESKDYESRANCQKKGYSIGTPEFDDCVKEERSQRMMQQQQSDYERVQQNKEDWRKRQMPAGYSR